MADSRIDLSNPEFNQVMSLIRFTDRSVFMTGKAGTGKSTFLRHITETTNKKHVVLAPTGIAAVNAGGQTLHSFFHIPLKPLLDSDPEFALSRLRNRMKYPKKFIKMLRDLELIIIDEISMVRADIIDFIDKILRYFCGNQRQPFAGKQLLMVGDVFQLEPVVTADAREILRREYSSFFFFSAKVFRDFALVPIELRKVYRQTDQGFIAMLDRVRAGNPNIDDFNALNTRLRQDSADTGSDAMTMTIATRRDIVDNINESRLEGLSKPAVSFEADVDGDFPDSAFPTDRQLTLKEGAQVVFIRNDPERRWVNGTLGKVSFLSKELVQVTLENGDIVDLEPEVWDNIEYKYNEDTRSVTENVKGSFRQYPVKLAWALTIHKSQGLTFSKITIDVGPGAFTGGQTYVALSRCTSLEGITLSTPLRMSDVYVNPFITRFAATFNNPGLITEAMAAARADKSYASAAHEFDKGNFTEAVNSFVEAVHARDELDNPLARKLIARKLHCITELQGIIEAQKAQIAQMQETLDALSDEYVELGNTCLSEGWEVSAALQNFDKALRLSPVNYDAMLGRGKAYASSGESDTAISAFIAADKAAQRYEAAYELGTLFMSIGDTSNAINYLNKALKFAKHRPEIHETLAEAYEISGDNSSAKKHRQMARKLRTEQSRRKKQ